MGNCHSNLFPSCCAVVLLCCCCRCLCCCHNARYRFFCVSHTHEAIYCNATWVLAINKENDATIAATAFASHMERERALCFAGMEMLSINTKAIGNTVGCYVLYVSSFGCSYLYKRTMYYILKPSSLFASIYFTLCRAHAQRVRIHIQIKCLDFRWKKLLRCHSNSKRVLLLFSLHTFASIWLWQKKKAVYFEMNWCVVMMMATADHLNGDLFWIERRCSQGDWTD